MEDNKKILNQDAEVKKSEKTLGDYIEALVGISYVDWQKLKMGIDRAFEMREQAFIRKQNVENPEAIACLIQNHFGGKVVFKSQDKVVQDVLEDAKKHNIPVFQAVINRNQLFDNFKNREE